MLRGITYSRICRGAAYANIDYVELPNDTGPYLVNVTAIKAPKEQTLQSQFLIGWSRFRYTQ
jgi:hypothetical protein